MRVIILSRPRGSLVSLPYHRHLLYVHGPYIGIKNIILELEYLFSVSVWQEGGLERVRKTSRFKILCNYNILKIYVLVNFLPYSSSGGFDKIDRLFYSSKIFRIFLITMGSYNFSVKCRWWNLVTIFIRVIDTRWMSNEKSAEYVIPIILPQNKIQNYYVILQEIFTNFNIN